MASPRPSPHQSTARRRAIRALTEPWRWPEPVGKTRKRWLVVGDPQTTFDRFADVLQSHDLLTRDGRLRSQVGLISVGDHFDFAVGDTMTPREVGHEGALILAWLASHPPDHAVILLGNHDTCRVQELAFETDESFAEAQRVARQLLDAQARGEHDTEQSNRLFTERFAACRIPTPQVAARDWVGFAEEQRRLVQSLLLAGRVRLAVAGRLIAGDPVLITHAGLTFEDQLALTAVDARTAPELATRLNRFLDARVAQVRSAWETGRQAALPLGPVHRAGNAGREGGGLLYHRPADRNAVAHTRWEDPGRRFDPRDLPRNLVQVCGHVTVEKCRKEMPAWVDDSIEPPPAPAPLFATVRWDGRRVTLSRGHAPPTPADATLLLVDAKMSSTAPEDYPLLDVVDVVPC